MMNVETPKSLKHEKSRIVNDVHGTTTITSSVRTSTVSPRNLIIQRTSYSTPSPLSASASRSLDRNAQYASGPSSGAYSAVTSHGVSTMKSAREIEKKDMNDLNDRFANYIDKVRLLEAQNRKLVDELEKLRSKWGKETSQVKAMFQAELDEARRLLDNAEKEKARLEIKVASLEEQIEELRIRLNEVQIEITIKRETLQRQSQQLTDYEMEITLLRKRLESLETDRDKDKKQISVLEEALSKTRFDLDNETLLHIDAENRRQTLEEEIEFLKRLHEQEMKELAALAYRDTSSENRDFWKNEMAQALREIQEVYDQKLELMRSELEAHNNFKLQEFRTGATRQNLETVSSKEESKRLRLQLTEIRDKLNALEARNAQLQRELDQLRREKEARERELEAENQSLKGEVSRSHAELEAILRELQGVMDTKLGLELEIAAYRKLLEGEESRSSMRDVVSRTSVKHVVEEEVQKTDESKTHVSKGEMSAKTSYQRSAKGPITIADCAPDGKFISLENTGRKEEELGGWKIKRTLDGQEKPDFNFGPDFVMKPSSKVKIWAKGCKPARGADNDLESDEMSWGIGANIITRLVNPASEDRATHVQKTVYSS